jgi:hypothetical protein
MRYWGPNAQNHTTTDELLAFNDGQCGAWARFFRDILLTQGVVVNYYKILPPPVNGAEQVGLQVNPVKLAQGGTPTASLFADHALLELGGTIYDPSYGGQPYPSQVTHEDSSFTHFAAKINGGWTWASNPPGTLESTYVLQPNP